MKWSPAGILLICLQFFACSSEVSPHRRAYDAQFELMNVEDGCRRMEEGGFVLYDRVPLGDLDGVVKCADEADRLVPEAAEYWLCRADLWEQRLDCARSDDCDVELCTIGTCPRISEEAELEWARAVRQCGLERSLED